MQNQIHPYEGNEPYIFVSYARNDKERVIPFLKALQEAGYRFWYDAGIAPGTAWNNAIAARLNKCAACIAFLSHASASSPYCDLEIERAHNKRKSLAPFWLDENANLLDGTDLIVRHWQTLKFSDCPPEALPQRLARNPAFQACRGLSETESQERERVRQEQEQRESERQELERLRKERERWEAERRALEDAQRRGTERGVRYQISGRADRTPDETLTNEVSAPITADGHIRIFIDHQKIQPSAPVRDVKDAFCETFFALADSEPSEFKRFISQYAFLQLTLPEIKGYFSLHQYKKYRMADETVFYIGHHSGSNAQRRQTDNLCRFLNKPEGYVVWLDENNQEIYRYHANETADDTSDELDDDWLTNEVSAPTESALSDSYSRAAAQKVTSILVYGDAYQTSTAADALHKTFSLTLARNPEKGRAFIRQYPNIVTGDLSKLGKSVFRSYKEIRLPGSDQPFYLACSTGFDLKKSQMEKLCDFMGLSENDVVWYDGTEKVFPAP